MTKASQKDKQAWEKRKAHFDKRVGARIREIRAKHGFRAEDVARMTLKSAGQIFRYESGDCSIEPAMLARLAEIFTCSAADFLYGLEL